MATAPSPTSRVDRRRAAVREEALDHAVDLMTEEGVGALTVSEVARRMGIRGPSLYKYFPSRFAVYDALFARGLAAQAAARGARRIENAAPGVDRIRAGGAAPRALGGREPRPRPAAVLAAGARLRAVARRPSPGASRRSPTARAVFAEAVRAGPAPAGGRQRRRRSVSGPSSSPA